MKNIFPRAFTPHIRYATKLFWGIAFVSALVLVVSVGFFIYQSKSARLQYADVPAPPSEEIGLEFPVGVDPARKEIVENPALPEYLETHVLVKAESEGAHTSWLGRAFAKLARIPFYQNFASLTQRTLVVQSGERKEEIANNFGDILGWTRAEEKELLTLIDREAPEVIDGKYFPGFYTVPRGAKPGEVAPLLVNRFRDEVLTRYDANVEAVVPLEDALIIASLLEREAYDFTDMREISGVIWNRLFTDMRLQIDATLQYAKGSLPTEPWWPKIRPNDKYIASAYNTYKNVGLPPAPIANPSLDAIVAALNPKKTDCMYYFHDKKAGFHCTETYEEHVELLKQHYGRGK